MALQLIKLARGEPSALKQMHTLTVEAMRLLCQRILHSPTAFLDVITSIANKGQSEYPQGSYFAPSVLVKLSFAQKITTMIIGDRLLQSCWVCVAEALCCQAGFMWSIKLLERTHGTSHMLALVLNICSPCSDMGQQYNFKPNHTNDSMALMVHGWKGCPNLASAFLQP